MGNACGSGGLSSSGDLALDAPGIEFQVASGGKKYINLIISSKNSSKLAKAAKEGRKCCVELAITIRSGTPSYVYMNVHSNGQDGRLSRMFLPSEQTVKLNILPSHTQNFKAGRYLLTVEGSTNGSVAIMHVAARTAIDGGNGWANETPEQQRDRLLAENEELKNIIEKQKEFILILKRKFLEKGEQLNEKEQQILFQKQKRVKFIIDTWRRRTIVPSFQAWATYTKERKARKKELLGKVVLRLGNSQVWRAWRVWKAYVDFFKVKGLKQALADEKGKRARQIIAAWRMRSCTPVFQAWKKWAHEYRAHKKQVLGKILNRLTNGSLWRSFRHWVKVCDGDKVATLQRKMAEMQGADRAKRIKSFLDKWRNKTIVPTFQAWRRYASENRGKKKRLMGKMILRMSQSMIYRAWRQWKQLIEDDKVSQLQAQLNKHKMKRAQALINAWRMRSCTPVFQAWKKYTQEKRGRKKVLLGKVIFRMQNSLLWRGFRHWLKITEQERVDQLQQNMANNMKTAKKRRIQALMSRWQKGTIVNVFKRWKEWSIKNRQRKKELLGKVVKRMSQSNLWQAYRQWKKYAEFAKIEDMRQSIRAEVMATMMHGGAKAGWTGSGAASGDYQALLAKYRALKNKKLTLEMSYDHLFKFLTKFRVHIARNIEEEIQRLIQHCKCDVCQTKRRMLTQNGINEWLFQFDRELIKFKYPG